MRYETNRRIGINGKVEIWKDDDLTKENNSVIGYRHGYVEPHYLLTKDNRKIASIINERGACGKLISIDDKLKLSDGNWVVICCTTDGPQWGVIILNNDVFDSQATNICTSGAFIAHCISQEYDFDCVKEDAKL